MVNSFEVDLKPNIETRKKKTKTDMYMYSNNYEMLAITDLFGVGSVLIHRDRKMADQVRQKIAEQESYLQQLKTSSQTLESHKKSRTAHKKLTIF